MNNRIPRIAISVLLAIGAMVVGPLDACAQAAPKLDPARSGAAGDTKPPSDAPQRSPVDSTKTGVEKIVDDKVAEAVKAVKAGDEAKAAKEVAKAKAMEVLGEVADSVQSATDFLADGRLIAARNTIQYADRRLRHATKQEVLAADPEVTAKLAEVKAAFDKANKAVDDAQRGCNGASMCIFGGAFLASYSMAGMWLGPRRGQSGHHIVSLVVPTAGFRYAFHESISVDVSVYTAMLSQDLKVSAIDVTGSGCRKGGGEFEDRLPCEGNAEMRPYAALNVGFTFGSEALGIISPGLTFGLARTTQDATAQPFFGILLGVGQVLKTIKVGR